MKCALRGYDNIDSLKIDGQDVADYLNAVIVKWGPPCDFCEHYINNIYCDRKHNPKRYVLNLGPYPDWALRKKCSDFEGKDIDTDNKEERDKAIRVGLDCNSQMYN